MLDKVNKLLEKYSKGQKQQRHALYSLINLML